MALEIERKFLLRSDTWRSLVTHRTLIRQGYLGSGSRSSVRARIGGDQAWINLKSKRSGMTRLEYEYPIPLADAHEILDQLCEGPLIEKYRHQVVVGPHLWEIDEFLGDSAGLIVAEIELGAENESFERPAWVGREVTEEQRYYNFNLAKHPFSRWTAEERDGVIDGARDPSDSARSP